MMTVGLVRERQGHGSTKYMKINAAYFAVVGEAITALPTRITVKTPVGIKGFGKQRKNMVFMKRVSDFLRHFGACNVKEVVARGATVKQTRGSTEFAP